MNFFFLAPGFPISVLEGSSREPGVAAALDVTGAAAWTGAAGISGENRLPMFFLLF